MRILLNKARYNPESDVIVTVSNIEHSKLNTISKAEMVISHLGIEIEKLENRNVEKQKEINFNWKAPKKDFQGYLVEIALYNNENRVIAKENTSIDVSSKWTKFPRYGYLTNFTSGVDTKNIIEEMKYWQINSIEYYDWKYLHHQLIPLDGEMKWTDWAGRKIDGNTVKSYIQNAKKNNIINMSYNMIYAATNNYLDYGIKEEWGLWYANSHGANIKKGDRFTFHMGESPSQQSDLYFFDLTNPDWQKYIIDKNLNALEQMGFDGWHGDTVGEWGQMWNYKNKNNPDKTHLVKDNYNYFLNIVKEKLGSDYYLSFNPVGAQGIEQVNTSNVDVLYAEIWPWDKNKNGFQYDSYLSLKKIIDQSRKESGGKSLIVPAYMEYSRAEKVKGEPFNMSAVLLVDAVVYAAGGSRIELGDGQEMLSNEYFPNKNLYMSDEHKIRQKKFQDFIVAYENILRDGLEDNEKKIVINNYNYSNDGSENSIWIYSKDNKYYEAIHLINLLGVTSTDWRAANGTKEKPTKVNNLSIKYYTDQKYRQAFITSPDPEYQMESKKLEFEYKEDKEGKFLEITVKSLEYWNMIYFYL